MKLIEKTTESVMTPGDHAHVKARRYPMQREALLAALGLRDRLRIEESRSRMNWR